MNASSKVISPEALAEAVAQLDEAAAAKKCWGCGCLHGSLDAIENAIRPADRPDALDAAIRTARGRLTAVKYDCLGCEVCWPPAAMDALEIDGQACPTDQVEARCGWPPLPGSYTTLCYGAPVAICTLTDEELAKQIVHEALDGVAIVGALYTENLGIERIIQNTLANPHIRFLILCGSDSRQAIGHLPGQSLAALADGGVDDAFRIVGARGRRPLLRNLDRAAIEHFQRTVGVVNLIGGTSLIEIRQAVARCAARDPGPAEPFGAQRLVATVTGCVPEHMTSDPSGYFVVYVDREHARLLLEHYGNDGVLDTVIEGQRAAELYIPAVERGLVSRLDHAAYLGRELARAEHALLSGQKYEQEAASEKARVADAADCGCASSCGGGS